MIIHKNSGFHLAGIILCCLLWLMLPNTARANDSQNPYEMNAQKASIPQNNTNSVQGTIKAQLSAINERDATLAYSFMTNKFHANYNSAKDFLSDIRFKFGPIYNHTDIEFMHSYDNERTFVQKIRLKDRYTGEDTTIIYKLVLQNTGNWLIDSFALIETSEAEPI